MQQLAELAKLDIAVQATVLAVVHTCAHEYLVSHVRSVDMHSACCAAVSLFQCIAWL